MMKAIIQFLAILIMVLAAFMLPTLADQMAASNTVTNIVKTPVTTKNLYQRGNKEVRTTDDAVVQSFLFFKETQNPDGSWGIAGQQDLSTPLVLMSFLARCETDNSPEFGNTVAHAHEWLLNANLTGAVSRLVAAVSLSNYRALSLVGPHPELRTDENKKIQALLMGTPSTNADVWVDFAAFHTTPAERSKIVWMRRTNETIKKYLVGDSNNLPLTVDEYLRVYLVGLANFYNGGNSWQQSDRTSKQKLMNWQQADGGYPVSGGQDRFAATALATLRLEINCQYVAPMIEKKERADVDK